MSANVLLRPSFRWVVVPALYGFGFAALLFQLTPDGVTRVFLSSVVLIFALVVVLGLVHARFFSRSAALFQKQVQKQVLRVADLLVVLVPLGPVAGYILLNEDSLFVWESIVLFSVSAILLTFLVLGVPLLLSRVGALAPTIGLATGLTYLITNMAQLSATFQWHLVGGLAVQLVVFLVVAGLVSFLYSRERSVLYGLAIVVFATAFLPSGEQPVAPKAPVESIDIVDSVPERQPNIYLLTYDSYVANETMQHYGIDNSAQENWLEEEGFALFPKVYSVAATTNATMGRLFGARSDAVRPTAGDGPFFQQLRAAGYETYGVFQSGYFFRGVGSSYDYSFPAGHRSGLTLGRAILEGEFRHNVDFKKPTNEEFVAEKRSVFRSNQSKPKFLYTHAGPGHSQNSGKCRTNETQLFEGRLRSANVEMREDVLAIRNKDPGAIIIVNGDHGPYLTLNCYRISDVDVTDIGREDLQDRYGTFLAVSGPREFLDSLQPKILQDMGPALLRYLYPDNPFTEYERKPNVVSRINASMDVLVKDGVIEGGRDDGEALFLGALN